MEGSSRIVSELLSKNNYEGWSVQVKTYLLGQDLWDVVESGEPESDRDETRPEIRKAWRQKNALALHAIQMSCGMREGFLVIKDISSAKAAWTALAEKYGRALDEHRASGDDKKPNSSGSDESRFAAWRENMINPNEEEEEGDEIVEKPSSPKNEPPSGSSANPGQGSEEKQVKPNDAELQHYDALFEAVSLGDWDTARIFLAQHPEAVGVRSRESGKNALHIAVSEGHLHIVEKLVEIMTDKEVEMTIGDGITVLAAAIEIKSTSIAKRLIRKNKRLLSISHRYYGLPVQQAVFSGQTEMARYLYSVTQPEFLDGRSGSDLLTHCIFAKQFDIALDLMNRLSHLAITASFYTSPVFVLSLAEVFPSGSSLKLWQQLIYDCIRIPDYGTNHILLDIRNVQDIQTDQKAITSFLRYTKLFSGILQRIMSNLLELLGIKNIYEMKLVHVQILELLSRMCKVIKSTSDEKRLEDAGVLDAVIEAAKKGNVEFIASIVEAKPQLLCEDVSRIVLDLSIELRHGKIFKLVYALQNRVARQLDRLTNMSVQKAASIAPSRLLNRIPGAALQMQRELQWYKEVERIASPLNRESAISHRDKKPRDVFTESHKDLVIAGEKWMKETSSSCTVVGALIITVTFAAAFTFPGGNDQNSGFPMFITMKLFRVFTLLNAIALFSSTTSVLMFLGILTSRYSEEDFLRSLPTKLIIGLSTLFLSIAAMIITFCVGLSIMFHQQSWIVVPSVSLACIPVALFAWMQFPLLRDILLSTYGPSIF